MKRIERGWILLLVMLTLLAVWVLPDVASSVEFLGFLLVLIPYHFIWRMIWLIVVALTIYFVLAPNNLFFTFVHEGTAKWVVRGNRFSRCLMRYEGYNFDTSKAGDEKWNIIPGKPTWYHRLLGGLRFYGIWPLWDIHIYQSRRIVVSEDGRETVEERWWDYIPLPADTYFVKIHATRDRDSLLLDVKLYLTISVLNPFRARFKTSDWLEKTINHMKLLIKQRLSRSCYSDLSADLQITGKELLQETEDADSIPYFQIHYGVEVKKIEISQIDPPEALQEAMLERKIAEQSRRVKIEEAEGKAESIEIIADAKAKEIEKIFLAIVKMVEEGNIPFSVISHYLSGHLDDREIVTNEAFKNLIKDLSVEFTKIEEVIDKLS